MSRTDNTAARRGLIDEEVSVFARKNKVGFVLAIVLGLAGLPSLLGNVTYTLAYLWAFTFQTLYLLLDSLAESDAAAFTAGEFPLSYGLVTPAVLGVGLALVAAGRWIATRRRHPTHTGRYSQVTPATGPVR